jgi:thioesterase domain-containing protein
MAATVHHLSGGSDWSHLVPINTEGRRTPLFFVPGGRGGEAELMFLYARLARELGTDQPFYGLHVPTGGAHVDQGMTTEQIAAAFVAEMRTVQPSGPYLIGGDCIGGLLAYEVAQQQRQAGETVRLLVLFETMPPQLQSARALDRLYRRRALAREIRHAAHFVRRAAMHAQRMATMNPLDWPTYARRRVRHGKRVVEENRTGRAVLHQARRHQRMLYDYVPRPYEGRIALFIARPRSEHEACRDWRQLARGGLDIHCLTGDHRSYVRDDIAATAALLRSVLDDA